MCFPGCPCGLGLGCWQEAEGAVGSGLSSLMLCRVGLALGELLLCILTYSRAAALGLVLYHGWGGCTSASKAQRGSCPVAEPNPAQVVWYLSPSPPSCLSQPCPEIPLIAPQALRDLPVGSDNRKSVLLWRGLAAQGPLSHGCAA